MKFYGWLHGCYRDDSEGPPSRYAKLSSKNRREARRRAKKARRGRDKNALAKTTSCVGGVDGDPSPCHILASPTGEK